MYSDYDTNNTAYKVCANRTSIYYLKIFCKGKQSFTFSVTYSLNEIDLLKILDMTGKRAFGSWIYGGSTSPFSGIVLLIVALLIVGMFPT